MDDSRRTSPRPIQPARQDLDVRVRVPGSKSVTNRALLLAGLATGAVGARVAPSTPTTPWPSPPGCARLGFPVDEDAAGAGA